MTRHAEPCPFCGSKAYECATGIGGPGMEHTWKYRLCCHACWTEGPTKRTLDEAYGAWNARNQAHSIPGDVGMREALADVFAAWDAHAAANDRTNEAIPPMGATRAEREVYAERYKASEEAKRDWFASMHRFVNNPATRAALTPSALSGEPVQKLHELPEGHRWCRHCEQKDPHCSVCEGVGYLPDTDPSALSGDAGEGE